MNSCAVGRRRLLSAFADTENTCVLVLFFIREGGCEALRPTVQEFIPTRLIFFHNPCFACAASALLTALTLAQGTFA